VPSARGVPDPLANLAPTWTGAASTRPLVPASSALEVVDDSPHLLLTRSLSTEPVGAGSGGVSRRRGWTRAVATTTATPDWRAGG
jgi:hypothetical protein